MAEQFENNYSTQLDGAINDSVTTLTIDAAPVNMTGEFRIKIDDEIILVGAVSGLTFTGCTRGAEGTTAASHADNAPVTHVLTAGGLDNLIYLPPEFVQTGGTFSTTTTCAVVLGSTPTVGNFLLAFLGSSGRGANSITQTNVTWTNLYTNNGNSRWCEIWIGAVSASAGTTATANFTGSANQFLYVAELDGSLHPQFTTASDAATDTAATGTYISLSKAGTLKGEYWVWIGCSQSTATLNSVNHPMRPSVWTGGQVRGGMFRSNGGTIATSTIHLTSSTALANVQYNNILVKLS